MSIIILLYRYPLLKPSAQLIFFRLCRSFMKVFFIQVKMAHEYLAQVLTELAKTSSPSAIIYSLAALNCTSTSQFWLFFGFLCTYVCVYIFYRWSADSAADWSMELTVLLRKATLSSPTKHWRYINVYVCKFMGACMYIF